MNACDVDCEIAVWGEWGQCSKACNSGISIRRKPVLMEAKGMGKCVDENAEESDQGARFEEMSCNADACPPNLVCDSKADIVFVLDGSGSVGSSGFKATKSFAYRLVERMNVGENATKLGLIRFASDSQVDKLMDMTFDKDGMLSAVDAMAWPMTRTATSKALLLALDVLRAGGRKDVDKDKTIVFLVTDGTPNNEEATEAAAAQVRANARLVVVPIGTGMGGEGLERMMSWATFPPEENCIQVAKYKQLPTKVSEFVADLCPDLVCNEDSTDAKMQDYIGCQTQTVSGMSCLPWEAVADFNAVGGASDEAAGPMPANLASKYLKKSKKGRYSKHAVNANLLGHNFCRNPDGRDGGIWCFTSSQENAWDYCAPRSANETAGSQW